MGVVSAVLSAASSYASYASSAKSTRGAKRTAEKQEANAEKLIADQKTAEAEETKRAEDKLEDRQRGLASEGRESTFASGQGGLTGSAPTKKKKLGR